MIAAQLEKVANNQYFIDADGNLNFVYIGRLDVYHKGLDLLINAIGNCQDILRLNKCNFEIYGPDGDGAIGKILKQSASPTEMITDADSYEVNFPSNASPEDKLLLTTLGLLIDYQYFEIDDKDDKKKKDNLAKVVAKV